MLYICYIELQYYIWLDVILVVIVVFTDFFKKLKDETFS